jgi:protein-tyrosine-phosphatase/predicted ATP-grasp superfamily ATP-dependent carboligase
MVMRGKVLVLGDDTRSFLAIVRSLGRRGITVHAAPSNFRSPALRSRYIAAIQELPPWMGDGAEWLAAMAALLRAERYDLIIPCNETTLLPLQRHGAMLSCLARLAIPEDGAIAVLFDKHETRKLARRVGVPVAAGRLARADDTAAAVIAEFGVPVVVKPRHSYSLERLASRGKVHVVAEPAHLEALLAEACPSATVLEEFFPGQGVGVSLLASSGRVLQAFEHRREREIFGASFYRFAAPLTPELVQGCAAIVGALGYTGLAMFEFKRAADGRFILLEINARPWGSMPLPLALGVDFPYRWYRLLTAGEESPPVAYRTGIYGRNLIPDLCNSLIEAETRRLGLFATAGFMIARLAELSRSLTGKEVQDVLLRDDPRPGLVEFLDVGRAIGRRVAALLPGAAARRRRRARGQVAAAVHRAEGLLRIIFVCQGNICRSPFAAALLRLRLSVGHVVIGSAGMLPLPGRSPPRLGLAAAAAYDIDLAAYRSAWLTRRMAEEASLLVVFDEITRMALLDRYPYIAVPLILLGDLARLGEIADPIDGGAAEFKRVYGQIETAITELAPLICGEEPQSRCASMALRH